MSDWIPFNRDTPAPGNLVQQYLGAAVLEQSNPPYWAFPAAVRWFGPESRDSAATHWRYVDPPRATGAVR